MRGSTINHNSLAKTVVVAWSSTGARVVHENQSGGRGMCELPLQDGRTGRLDAVSSDTGADFNITDVRTVTHLLEAPCTRIDDDGVHHIATPGAAVSISLDIASWKKTIKYHHPCNAIGLRFVPSSSLLVEPLVALPTPSLLLSTRKWGSAGGWTPGFRGRRTPLGLMRVCASACACSAALPPGFGSAFPLSGVGLPSSWRRRGSPCEAFHLPHLLPSCI